MSSERQVTITLTDAQVARIVREASGPAGFAPAFSSALSDPGTLAKSVLPFLADQGYSRSVLRALLVLAAFPSDGSERELSAVAEQLSLSGSTTHRYLRTWTAVGVLERDPDSRRYRRSVLGGAER
jgi:IclR helix-turn-helix domain